MLLIVVQCIHYEFVWKKEIDESQILDNMNMSEAEHREKE